MLSREAVVTTKGDPEHTGAVHGSQCRVSPQRTNSLCPCRAVTLMWGCKNKGVHSLWLHVPWEVGMALFGEPDLHHPAPSLPPTSPLQPGKECSSYTAKFLMSQVTVRQALDREISGPRPEEF